MTEWLALRVGALAACGLGLAGCAQQQNALSSAVTPVSYTTEDRDCMARAIYFESHRGGEDGMRAVGTVVQNRLRSGRYGSSVCDVVGQKGQFAAGVMTRPMVEPGAERARKVAGEVLAGKSHKGVGGAMFFHTAGLKFRYPNMHYVLVAGGNAFYEKREVASAADARDNARSKALALAYARIDPTGAAKAIAVGASTPNIPAPAPAPIMVASAEPTAPAPAASAAKVVAPAEPQLASAASAKPAPALANVPAQAVAVAAKPRTLDVAKASAEPALAAAVPPAAAKAAQPRAAATPKVVEIAKTEPAKTEPVKAEPAAPAKPAPAAVETATAEPAAAEDGGSAWSRIASAFSSMPNGGAPAQRQAAGFAAPAYAEGR